MRLLLDQNLPVSLVARLEVGDHDIVHASSEDLERASDPEIFGFCEAEERILVTADKKLTKYLASEHAAGPTVIVPRGFDLRGPQSGD